MICVGEGKNLSDTEVAEISRLIRLGGQVVSEEDLIRRTILASPKVASMKIDGKIIAFICLKRHRVNQAYAKVGIAEPQGKVYERGYLVVDERYRGKGLTKTLFSLIDGGLTDATMYATVRSNNEAAINSHLGDGFIKKGTYTSRGNEILLLEKQCLRKNEKMQSSQSEQPQSQQVGTFATLAKILLSTLGR